MRLLWAAIRAVSVEMLGVLFVVWMLFSTAGWTLESAGAKPLGESGVQWFASMSEHVSSTFAIRSPAEERAEYVSDRLDHYSQLYGRAARGYFNGVERQLSSELSAHSEPTPVVANQLLGTL